MGPQRPLLFSSLPRGPLAMGPLRAQEQVLGVVPMGQCPWVFYSQAPWARLGESPKCSISCPRCPSSFKWRLPQHQPLGPRRQLLALHPPPASVSPSRRVPPPTAKSWLPLHPLLASPSCSPYPLPRPPKVRPRLGSARRRATSLFGSLVIFPSLASCFLQSSRFLLCRPHPQVVQPSCYLGRYLCPWPLLACQFGVVGLASRYLW